MAKIITDTQHYSDIAAAIRIKNETETLYKPSEMAPAILAIQGGGADLNFEVVGGTTQPENPKENTIWVNTDQEITGWSFSGIALSEPNEGVVWFEIGDYNSVGVNILTENEAFVYPLNAKQYVDGSWTVVPAKTYSNSQWLEWFTYLINGNNLCTAITGGWTARGLKVTQYGAPATAPTITKNENGIQVYLASNGDGIYMTANKINLSGYTKLVFEVESSVAPNGENSWLNVNAWTAIGTYQQDNCIYNKRFYPGNDQSIQIPINTTQSCHIGFGIYNGGTINVKSVYLE